MVPISGSYQLPTTSEKPFINKWCFSGWTTCGPLWIHFHSFTGKSRVGISGTTAKSREPKFVPSSHPGPFTVVALSRKSKTKVGTLPCFDFLH